MTDPRPLLCKDCRYFQADKSNLELHLCHCPNLSKPNLVTGQGKPSFCHINREHKHLCGVEGKFFFHDTPDAPFDVLEGV